MTLNELRELLDDLARTVPGDVEVRLAHQPQWPFEYSIDRVVVVDLGGDEREDWQEALRDPGLTEDERADVRAQLEAIESQEVVYIGEGSQLGYLPGVASRELDWR